MKKLLGILALVMALCMVFSIASAAKDSDSEFEGMSYADAMRVHQIDEHEVSNPRIARAEDLPNCYEMGILRFDCDDEEHNADGIQKFHELFITDYTDEAGEFGPAGTVYKYGHQWTDWVHEEDGLMHRECTVCGATEERATEHNEHVWSHDVDGINWGRVTEDPACWHEGYAEDYCVICGEVNTDILPRVIQPTDHDFSELVVDEPFDCLTEGLGHFICSVCGTPEPDPNDEDGIEDETDEDAAIWHFIIPAVGHDWQYPIDAPVGQWYVEKPATCYHAGTEINWCKICAQKTEREIPIHEHDFDDGDWVIVAERLIDCFTMERTYVCPECGSLPEYEGADPIHPEVKVQEAVSAHVYRHTKDYEVEKVEPTCEEDGYIAYECIFADEVDGHDDTMYDYVVLPALGHDWGEWRVRAEKDAQGNDYGYYIRTCKRCGKVEEKISRYAPEPCAEEDHEWELIEGATVAPTCTEAGVNTYKCAICGKEKYEDVEALGHNYVRTVWADATCVKSGLAVNTCSVCGDTYNEEIPATGVHDYQLIETVNPTCTEEGKNIYKCTMCGELKEEAIEALGEDAHEFNLAETIAPTCTEEGKNIYKCAICGETKEEAIEATGHNYVEKVWTNPTCVANGLKEFTCVNCNDKYTEEIPATGEHDFVLAETIEPTCIAEGKKIYKCTMCDEIKEEAIEALGEDAHEFELTETVAPTCTEEGKNIYTCTICGTEKEEAIEATGHTFEEKIWKDATCVDVGMKELTCSVCGFKKTEEIPATGDHEFELAETVDPTCVDAGKNIYKCAVCGEEKVEEIAATGEHNFELAETVESTCIKAGKKVYKCTVCGEEKVEELELGDHDYELYETVAATCTEAGKNVYICSVCNIAKIEEIEALGHDVVVDEAVAPTVEATGLTEGSHCARCGEVLVAQEELPKLLHGLVKMDDGDWYYYEEGKFIDDKTGIVEFEGGKFIVVNGVKSKAMGLTNCPGDVFYYLVEGQIQEVTQLAEYKGAWFAIKDGALDTSVNGLVDYDGSKFLFSDGWLRKDINGLCQVGDDWYFFANGQLQQVSQVASYDGEFFVIKDGKLDAGYNGTIEYDGATFNVVAGQLYPIAE
jgi:DNA-directed RNA polymerase subunit RPC12/RpoP